jgi:HK97 family phage major capsid protein
MPEPIMTEEEKKALVLDIKTFLSGEVEKMKAALMADLKGEYGKPDEEYQKLLDERIGEMEDQIKDLLKPKTTGMQRVDDAYDELYGKGVEGWGQFAIDVKEWAYGRQEERLAQYKAAGAGLQENVDSEGGFLVPTEESRELLTLATAESQLLSRVRMMPMSSNTLKLNYIKETDRSGGALFGGAQMYWVAEEGTTTATKPALAQVTLSLNKLFGLTYATSELIEDSPISIGPWLSQQFATAFGWQMDYEIINGTGAGRPEGIINSNALISITAESEQQAATIVAQNIMKMYARMPARNRQNAIWLNNEDTLPQLMQMTLTVGTGGVPVWLPANGLANQPFDTLMGKEMVTTEHCQTVGTAGDLIFADLTQYLMGQKSASVRRDMSIHLKFETDETAFRFIYRVDGKCPWPSALTPRHSSDTLSPIVAIATRS